MDTDQLGLDLGGGGRDARSAFDPETIRGLCGDLIAQARANGEPPTWDAETLDYNRLIFPHVASWLPDAAERAQLCFEFDEACRRIEMLLAA